MFEINNFDSIKIGLASPEKIREWSCGEVTKPETINYRTQKPEPDGLFCQKIFGPTKDWECACGKYKRIRHKGVVCDRCGVKVEQSKVRRERMGHIELAAPVAHLWYLKGTPSRIATILDMPPKEVEHVVYYASYVVLDPGTTGLHKKQVLNDIEYRDAIDTYGEGSFKVGMGAESIKILLQEIDLDKEIVEIRKAIAEDQKSSKDNAQAPKRMKLAKKLEIVEAFKATGSKPEWMIIEALPVLPPELRPMVPLDGGRYATSDLNDLYRFVISRNRRLKHFLQTGGVDAMIRNEKRMLQVAVDNLIDNSKKAKSNSSGKSRELKSLTAMLRGKQGRFRQNLLGKRVDYSGRSVIVVGPELKLYQCGLPKEMALELFKPFIMKELVERNICNNIKNAKRYVERARSEVWDVLEDIIKDHPVLLNRAPTLHRLGIQAFEPVLVEGRAIKLHPLVCGAFNADFDGDQMAVHVPLSIEAQAEARFLMLSTNNILKLSDGKPVMTPTQDMILGSYYLTIEKEGAKGEGKYFMSVDEAKLAYANKDIELQAKIYVRVSKEIDGKVVTGRIHTTLGRFIFNEAIPQDLHFVDRSDPANALALEIDFLVGKKQLGQIVEKCFKYKGSTETAVVLDKIKAQGFKYSTIGALTTSVFDMHIPKEKDQIIADAEKKVADVEKLFRRGHITDAERAKQVIAIWNKVTDDVTDALSKCWDKFNPIKMMEQSGARGNMSQIRQLAGMRGLMKDPTGKTIELPVKSNFREGLSALEYFISSHGGRKGLADTALKTAESGYLTRRLVDVSQSVIIRDMDCGDKKGIVVSAIYGGRGDLIEVLKDRIIGRYTIDAIVNPKTGEEIVPADAMISEEAAKEIEKAGIESVKIRSVFTCKCATGLCSKCYGKNMASGNPVKIGEAVGVIAAQSIGEPGTQLTMRTFHTGGVASSEDITQGLPRVEELFECRNPKAQAIISDIAGTVTITEKNKKRTIVVENEQDRKEYVPALNAKVLVTDGQEVDPGTQLTQGAINLQDLLRTRGVKGVQDYLIREVKDAYRLSGVDINDKHIEIIIRQMMRKVRIEKQGDTDFLPGELVDLSTYEESNRKVLSFGGEPATAKRTLLGITKASLASESFLASASFQETTRVLTDAAIKGKVDPLLGLKENVILGKLIPAGTGLKMYQNVNVQPNALVDSNAQDENSYLA
ncbi:MAG: DNA-directed RNA polymerase subunit beta' [Clostridia bacterium]|nr:DNA-directed RNA polymerase subunit beta' [Clostridia bacterium]